MGANKTRPRSRDNQMLEFPGGCAGREGDKHTERLCKGMIIKKEHGI